MVEGTRVKVYIPDDRAHTWARNYLVAVQGLTGFILEEDATFEKYLVAFDDPPKDPSPVAPRGRKLTQFWIPAHSLTRLAT